jgi:3-deoxy-D-manno-octulosonic-acid transferase
LSAQRHRPSAQGEHSPAVEEAAPAPPEQSGRERFETAVDGLPGPLLTDPYRGPVRTVLHLVYDVAWLLAIALGSPWLLWKSATTPGFGRMCLERLGAGLGRMPRDRDQTRRRVLVHGVSVGEVKAAQSVVRVLREEHPGWDVVVSASTNTGLTIAREVYGDLEVVRYPLDVSFIVRRFLRRVRPDIVVLVELEIWPNFLRSANRHGIPVAVINGRITDKSHGQYRFFRRLLPQFNRLSLYCVQSEEYAARFRDLSVDPARMVVTGNVKADGLAIGRVNPGPELARLLGARPGQPVLVAGSTHEPEERLIAEAWLESAPEARLVLVPRHPQRAAEIARALGELGAPPQRLTELRSGRVEPDATRPAIVDTIGELERVYGLADLCFVGGSLVPHGGQNVLEPAAQGVPVITGPHVQNFQQEIALLQGRGACLSVADRSELGEALRVLLADGAMRERMGAAGLEVVAAQRGATALTLSALERVLLGPNPGPPPWSGVSS